MLESLHMIKTTVLIKSYNS